MNQKLMYLAKDITFMELGSKIKKETATQPHVEPTSRRSDETRREMLKLVTNHWSSEPAPFGSLAPCWAAEIV
jgi:hypothetical protein